LGGISNDTFSQLVALSKKITDYGGADEQMLDPEMERKHAKIDEEMGVAVVFDEEEQDEEEEDEEGYEIRDESDDEEGEDDADAQEEAEGEEEAGTEEFVIGGSAAATQAGNAKGDKDLVSSHVIDGFWVQRQISEVHSDPVTAADKAASSVLASESSLRDCENQLMELFECQGFHPITKFLKNRDVIVLCIKWMRSDADERANVEAAMREKGVGWILRELTGGG
jgi:pre-mRNA-splicing helicase BRR2